jgi:hypothetical protein
LDKITFFKLFEKVGGLAGGKGGRERREEGEVVALHVFV